MKHARLCHSWPPHDRTELSATASPTKDRPLGFGCPVWVNPSEPVSLRHKTRLKRVGLLYTKHHFSEDGTNKTLERRRGHDRANVAQLGSHRSRTGSLDLEAR